MQDNILSPICEPLNNVNELLEILRLQLLMSDSKYGCLQRIILLGIGCWIYRRFTNGGTSGGDEESLEEEL